MKWTRHLERMAIANVVIILVRKPQWMISLQERGQC